MVKIKAVTIEFELNEGDEQHTSIVIFRKGAWYPNVGAMFNRSMLLCHNIGKLCKDYDLGS